MTDLMQPLTPATLNGGATKRCRRHQWCSHPLASKEPADGWMWYCDVCSTPLPNDPACSRCGAVKNARAARTNRNNRKRGNRTSRDLAAYLGGRNVEALKLPWDVEAAGCRVQSKRLASTPSRAEIVRLIEYIDASDALRALYYVRPGQRLASGTVYVLAEEWVAWHGWRALPAVTQTYIARGWLLLEMPVATFRDLHIAEALK